MTKTGSLMFVLIFMMAVMSHAATTVRSSVDRTEMGLGDTFTYSLAVASTDSVEAQEPRLPNLDGFDLLNKWEQTSVSQKMVNTSKGMQFETQRRKDFNFMLSPKRKGTLKIDPFEVVVDGKAYRTQSITVVVGDTSTGGRRARGGRPPMPSGQMPPGFDTGDQADQGDQADSAEEDLFNQLLRQREQMLQGLLGGNGGGNPNGNGGLRAGSGMTDPQFRSLPKNPNEAFFIQVEVDKTEVYEGEQVTVNWYLYTRGQMESLDRLKFPDLRGFWKEIIEEVPTIQFSEEVVNGIPYKKALLASHALFPIKAGNAYIDEYKIKARVRLPVNGMGGFFGRSYEFTKSSEKVKITVKPLPTEGRPSDFTGAVGQFEATASLEGQSFPVNQPFSLKVRFEGAGNAKLIDLPAMNLPPGIEVYDTKSESKFFKNGRSYKEFEVLIIPRQEGEMTIPALSSSFFDSQSRKYYTKNTQSLKVQIVANPNAPNGASNRISDVTPSPNAKVVKQDVLPELLLTWENPRGIGRAQMPMVWGSVFGLIFLSLILKARSAIGFGQRRKGIKDLVQKRMKKVDQAIPANDYRRIGAEMTNIFYLVLGESIGESGSSVEITKLLEKAPPSLRRDFADDIMRYFEVFQTLSFAPEEMLGSMKQAGIVQENVTQAKKLIARIIASTSDAEESKS